MLTEHARPVAPSVRTGKPGAKACPFRFFSWFSVLDAAMYEREECTLLWPRCKVVANGTGCCGKKTEGTSLPVLRQAGCTSFGLAAATHTSGLAPHRMPPDIMLADTGVIHFVSCRSCPLACLVHYPSHGCIHRRIIIHPLRFIYHEEGCMYSSHGFFLCLSGNLSFRIPKLVPGAGL